MENPQERYNERVTYKILNTIQIAFEQGADFKDFALEFDQETLTWNLEIKWKDN